jgi:hypothetical protein
VREDAFGVSDLVADRNFEPVVAAKRSLDLARPRRLARRDLDRRRRPLVGEEAPLGPAHGEDGVAPLDERAGER